MAGNECLDCPYLEEHAAIAIKFFQIEQQAEKKEVLLEEGSVACRGIQEFWRRGLLEDEKVKRCPFQFHAPAVSDKTIVDELAKVASTEPRPLIRD